jgi:hypothetical protein
MNCARSPTTLLLGVTCGMQQSTQQVHRRMSSYSAVRQAAGHGLQRTHSTLQRPQ